MTNTSGNFPLPYPEETSPVNVHGDIKSLASGVSQQLSALNLSIIQVTATNDSGALISAGDPVAYTSTGTIVKATSTTSPILGLAKTSIANGANGTIVVAGVLQNINTSGLGDPGSVLYAGTTGGLTTTRPVNGSGAVGIISVRATSGIVIVEAKGNGTWGALKAGLA